MKTKTYASIAVTLTVAGLALSSGAWAIPVMTADAVLNGPLPNPSMNTSGAFASANLVGGEYAGRSASASTGHLGVSAGFLGDSGGSISVGASATWTDTFDFLAGPATFDFFIPGAAIGFESNNVPGLTGSFLVEIFLNGTNIFTSGADVATLNPSPSVAADLQLTQTGTPLMATFANDIAPAVSTSFGLPIAGYRFASFSGNLDLSTMATVGTNTIEYSMQAMVSGSLGETSAIAAIGDPLNLNQQLVPGVTLTTVNHAVPVSVPEPTTLSLLGAGLLAIGFGRRRRQVSA